MKSGMGRGYWIGFALLTIWIIQQGVFASESSANEKDSEPRQSMHLVFEALSHLLPIGIDEKRFVDPAEREEIQKWLDVLAEATQALGEHAGRRDPSFRNLSRSLAADVDEIRYRYQLGRPEEARYFLIESTKNCVACHSRLPRDRDFPLAKRLIENIDMDSLSAHEQVGIQIATRQFEAALTTWEKYFGDLEVPALEFDLGGYLLDYLTIAIRVVQDTERPRRTLVTFSQRKDLPSYLRRHVERWIDDLSTFVAKGEPTLDRAREILRGSDRDNQAGSGRERMIRDLLASGVLLRFIDKGERANSELAEAYYLLGATELRSIEPYWVPQADFHLEAAIRVDPGGPFAVKSYTLLEESILVGYGGSGGLHLPADVWANLVELRKLAELE